MNEIIDVEQICKEYPQFNKQKVCRWLRTGKLKAQKIGTKYFVNRTDLYKFLGIDNNNNKNENQKNIEEIKMLKTELDIYKKKYNRIKIFLETAYKEII